MNSTSDSILSWLSISSNQAEETKKKKKKKIYEKFAKPKQKNNKKCGFHKIWTVKKTT